jgi:phospholipid-binding lipoprotein MlaA
MSFSALTIAMAVAAVPLPSDGAPASGAAFGFEPVVLDQSPLIIGPGAESVQVSGPFVPAQSMEPPQSTESGQSAESTQPTELPSLAQAETQAPAPAEGQGEIIVTGRRASPEDPLEELNATSYEAAQAVDKAFVAPVAFAYKEAMPRTFRRGLRNFLHNLGEPIVFLNYMLQAKPGKAAETLGRFAINTTMGAAGLVDIAKRKPFNLPHRRNGFANTLGYYGVKPGPYFYLPLVGSTTLRDFIGNRLDLLVLPTALGGSIFRPEFAVPVAVLSELNSRIEFDDELREIRATRDPYVAARTYYLRKRQAEIDALHGRGVSPIPVTVPAPAATDPTPAPTSPAPTPAQDPPPRPNPTEQ